MRRAVVFFAPEAAVVRLAVVRFAVVLLAVVDFAVVRLSVAFLAGDDVEALAGARFAVLRPAARAFGSRAAVVPASGAGRPSHVGTSPGPSP